GAVYGNPDAPITIMEFGDYQCSGCAYFGLSVKPLVDMTYIEDGHAKLVFHDFPLSHFQHSFLAARAARCAGDQDRYFEYHDAVFRTQPDWSVMQSTAGHFKDLADDLGLDTGTFNDCLDSDAHAELVTANMTLGMRLGVAQTPTVFVHDGQNSRRLAGAQFADIQAAIEALQSGNQ
ncbi:MAG: DsbA family protein, partial [Gemmatimonadetes bacterium]|nr:DsbA family protein [Gemmatimonadota bacterium]